MNIASPALRSNPLRLYKSAMRKVHPDGILGASSSKSSTSTTLHEAGPKGIMKQVSFNCRVQVFFVPAISEYSVHELLAMWFRDYEYEQIKSNNRIIAKLAKRGYVPPADDDNFCYRGLETRCDRNVRDRRNAKFQAMDAVFFEQRRLEEEYGAEKEASIRQTYRTWSAIAEQRARMFGESDAMVP